MTDNRKPVLSSAEGSAIENPKWKIPPNVLARADKVIR